RAYYGIGNETPGGPPLFNSISSFCLVCSLDFTFPLDGSSLVSWRPARIDHRTSRVAEPRLDRVHLRFAFISNSSCSINRSRNGLSELACFLECAFGLRPLGRKGTGLIDLRLNGRVRGGEDQGGRKPQRETFHRATRFFREALSQTFPLLPPQAKRFQDTRRPSESEQPRENLLGSSKKN
ncbi:hypothetical protein V6N13_057104, partial [Hibiscus sabdariffa]